MIKLVGDLNFADGYFDTGFGVGSSIELGLNPLQNIERLADDFWIGNFECVCSSVSDKEGIAGRQFRIKPDVLSKLTHLDVYNVANNHVMQHGEQAYVEMLNHIQSWGCQTFGSKQTKSIVFQHQGKNVSITGFNQRPENFSNAPSYWAMPEYSDIKQEVSTLSNVDFKICYVHWGNEFINKPYIDQVQFAHMLVDLGYDLIVGMHPHVLQGYEKYKDKYIFYSIGNFVFNMAWYKTKYSVVINVDLSTSEPIIGYDYIAIDKSYRPCIVAEESVPSDCRFAYLNELLVNQVENEQYYTEVFAWMSKYRKANYREFIRNLPKLNHEVLADILFGALKRRLK